MMLVRLMLTVLGIALFVLGALELGGLSWVAWCDIVIGLLVILEANVVYVGLGAGKRRRAAASASPIVLGLALFVIGIVALSVGGDFQRGAATIFAGIALLFAARARALMARPPGPRAR